MHFPCLRPFILTEQSLASQPTICNFQKKLPKPNLHRDERNPPLLQVSDGSAAIASCPLLPPWPSVQLKILAKREKEIIFNRFKIMIISKFYMEALFNGTYYRRRLPGPDR